MKPIKTKDLKTYPVADYPYVVEKPGSDPVYRRSHKEALGRLVTELGDLASQFKRTNNRDGLERISQIVGEVGELPLEGGSIDRVVDAWTGIRYRVTLRLRDQVG